MNVLAMQLMMQVNPNEIGHLTSGWRPADFALLFSLVGSVAVAAWRIKALESDVRAVKDLAMAIDKQLGMQNAKESVATQLALLASSVHNQGDNERRLREQEATIHNMRLMIESMQGHIANLQQRIERG